MRLLPVVVVALASVLLFPHHASAFSSDPSSGTNADGSSRYVDPDDQISSHLGAKGDEGSDSGYDSSSGRRKQPAQEVITGQGVLAPNSYFSATPSHH
jgi:hypothetical protein